MKRLVFVLFCLMVFIVLTHQSIEAKHLTGYTYNEFYSTNSVSVGLDLNQDTPPKWPEDAQSTTGPIPPEGITLHEIIPLSPAVQTTIPNVPAYLWTNGCGPTAAGMVLGYWDGQGFDNLVPGDASTQTADVNAMISSTGNYNDYCLPIDSPPDPIQEDKSELPVGDEHSDDSVADFMKTSQSYWDNYYGWSWFSHVDDALNGYVSLVAPEYTAVATNQTWGTFNWTAFKAEIDGGRPVVLLVDTDGNGSTDHFIPAFGYNETGGGNFYGCYNTWDYTIHWYEFAQMSSGQDWGIYGATLFQISGNLPGSFGKVSPSNLGFVETISPTLNWEGSSDAASYEYCIDTSNNNICNNSWVSVGNTTSASLSGLVQGMDYYWQVRARNSSGFTGANNGQWWYFSIGQKYRIYLPAVLNNQSLQLVGTVTDQGVPVNGTEVLLRYYNGSSWSTYSYTYTDSIGKYQFTTLPTLSAGQEYYVRWDNMTANPDQLWGWYCDHIDSTTTDPNAYICDFDIKNIVLLSPDSGSTVSLPQTFTWLTRTLTTDDYELNLADMSDGVPWWWTDPSLGYMGSYTLNSLPTGFSTGIQYGWWMWVYGSNGYGESYYYRPVTFSTSGSQVVIEEAASDNLFKNVENIIHNPVEEKEIK